MNQKISQHKILRKVISSTYTLPGKLQNKTIDLKKPLKIPKAL